MVERVARGRIMVPAAAALTVMAAGMLKPTSADAAGRDTTLQIRVQVVEPCRIRIAHSGAVEHGCGGGDLLSQAPVSVQISRVIERFDATIRQHLIQPERPPLFSAIATPPSGIVARFASKSGSPSARPAAANQRASAIAERIVQRVRHITVAY